MDTCDFPMTQPVFNMLNRDKAVADARKLIEVASPLLLEIVNYSTGAYRRCISGQGIIDWDMPAFALYRHVIEVTDGIEVLISASCCEPTVPLIRSSFEAHLELKYLLQKDYENRSKSWLFFERLRQVKEYSFLDPSTQIGREFRQALDKESPEIKVPDLSPDHLAYIRSRASDPALKHIEQEYDRTQRRFNKTGFPWYALFDGPQDIRALAKHLSLESMYIVVYPMWSSRVHPRDTFGHLQVLPDGILGEHQLRVAENLLPYARWAGIFLWQSADSMIRKFRPNEPSHPKWHDHIKDRLKQLPEIPVTVLQR